jgi:ribosomal protein L29
MKQVKKDFDCVQMKNEIQAKIYAEIKNMNSEELMAHLNDRLKTSLLYARMQKRTSHTPSLRAQRGITSLHPPHLGSRIRGDSSLRSE